MGDSNRILAVDLVGARKVAEQDMVRKYWEILAVEDEMFCEEQRGQVNENRSMKGALMRSVDKRDRLLNEAGDILERKLVEYQQLKDQKDREISALKEKHGAECKEAEQRISDIKAHETQLGYEVESLTEVTRNLRAELKSLQEKLDKQSDLETSEHQAATNRKLSDLYVSHQRAIGELKTAHGLEMIKLANGFTDAQKRNSVAMQQLKTGYEEKINQLGADSQIAQQALAGYRTQIDKLKDNLADNQKTYSDLVQKLKTEHR